MKINGITSKMIFPDHRPINKTQTHTNCGHIIKNQRISYAMGQFASFEWELYAAIIKIHIDWEYDAVQ
jgi:hypothetical protein